MKTKVNNQEKTRMEAKKLWIKACRFDGINPSAKFVSWSSNNPYDKPYNKAMEMYIHYRFINNSISVI